MDLFVRVLMLDASHDVLHEHKRVESGVPYVAGSYKALAMVF